MALNVNGINSASVGAFLAKPHLVHHHFSLAQTHGSVNEHLQSFSYIWHIFVDASNGLEKVDHICLFFKEKKGAWDV